MGRGVEAGTDGLIDRAEWVVAALAGLALPSSLVWPTVALVRR